jgi:phage N-6-adenine-methyltransferase
MVALFNNIDFPQTQHGELSQGKSNEWYTPARYVEAARQVMGGIDLDPASCELANKTIKAAHYYTEQDDGLSKEWYGRVWLNPPYGKTVPYTIKGRFRGGGSNNAKIKTLQVRFITKAIEDYKAKRIEQAILLVTANITLSWFQPLWEYPICTPYPKMSFYVPGVSGMQRQVFGNVFVYLGLYVQRFIEVFSRFGPISQCVNVPRQTVTPLSLWEGALL